MTPRSFSTETWLKSVSPTVRAVARQYHFDGAQFCPGTHDPRCCRYRFFQKEQSTEPRKKCVGVRWTVDDPEYYVLKIMKLIEQIQKQDNIRTSLEKAVCLGVLIRDFEILFFDPEDVDKVSDLRSEDFRLERLYLHPDVVSRILAVERALTGKVSLSRAWDIASKDLGCSRSTIRRAWDARNGRRYVE